MAGTSLTCEYSFSGMRHNIGIIGKDRQSRDGNGFALTGGDGPQTTDRVGTETASRRRED